MSNANIVIGVTGGIAAFKTAQLVSDLKKKNYNVQVIMTKNATEFITPLTFETLSKNKVYIETFDRNYQYDVNHISIAKMADVFCVVPATANIIGKIANGLADDMLTTTFMACKCHKIICPAMNTNMYDNPIVQDNIKKCKEMKMEFVEPNDGLLACGDVGKGKLVDIDEIIEAIESSLVEKLLKNKNVLVTAGPTKEKIDPVRFISNHSSGKMGFAIAKYASMMGANVTLISGDVNLKTPRNVKRIDVVSASEMFEAVKNNLDNNDYIIKAAAVADYTYPSAESNKIKKNSDDLNLSLTRTVDILQYIGKNRRKSQIICGFAMETENLQENALKKLKSKNCDLIVANNLNVKGAGFKGDTNVVTLVSKDEIKECKCMSKIEVAKMILEKMIELEN